MIVHCVASRLRVLLHTQHGEGVGHYVRTSEIAKALAEAHDVMLTDGGRPVPRGGLDGVTMLSLPRVARRGSEYFPLEDSSQSGGAMQTRQRYLREAIGTLCPDVVVVEHYPFSKWVLEDEIIGFVMDARAANRTVKVVCSVRDIHPRTRREVCSDEDYAREVARRLSGTFDAILVHGDPAFSRLEEHLPFLAATGVPLAYTGIVSEKPAATPPERIAAATEGAPFILASVGGGVDRSHLLRHTLEAWEALTASGQLTGWKLVLSPGLSAADDDLAEQARHHGKAVILRRFGSDFLSWLQAAALSVSCAGYNTSANLLQTGCRAVLIPDPQMGDQTPRAQLFAERRLATVVPSGELTRDTLAAAMLQSLAVPKPHHAIALDGAARTRMLIEEIAGRGEHVSLPMLGEAAGH